MSAELTVSNKREVFLSNTVILLTFEEYMNNNYRHGIV